MWFLFFIELSIALLFLLIGWGIVKKKAYWLISGFNTASKDEQEQLIENGMPQKVGKLLIFTAIGMIILLPLIFTSFTYAMEVQFGFMLIFLLGGIVYLSKYDIAKKRKRSYIISSSLFVIVIGLVGTLLFFGYQAAEFFIDNDSFQITGMYGDEWSYDSIEKVELLDKMPPVTSKVNGFGMSTVAKGTFTVTGYGNSLLFIQKDSTPYLSIKLKDKQIFLNNKDPEQTKLWYEQLIKKID